MKRLLSLTLIFILATLVGAQNGASRPSPADQAKMLEKNRELMKVTVEKGLDLTTKNGSLERAVICTKLAGEWSKAIQAAASAKDSPRVRELGGHFDTVLNQGVVNNLQRARKEIAKGSQEEKQLELSRDEAIGVLKGLEDVLRGAQEFEPVVKKIHEGRSKVEQAAQIDKR